MKATSRQLYSALGSLRPAPVVIGVYAIASVVGALISLTSASGGLWVMAALTITITVVAVLVLLTANALPWGRIHSRPLASASLFLTMAAVVGLVRGLTFVQLASWWDIRLSSDDASQIVNSTLSALVWLTLAGLVVGGRDRYRGRYRALLLHGDVGTDWDSHPSVAQVKRSLQDAVDRSANTANPNLVEVAEAIRREIETNIRPLSHRLWFGTEDEEPRWRFMPLVRDAVSAWSVPVRTVLAVWLITAVVGGSRWIGFERAIVAALATTSILAIVLITIGRWVPPSPWLRGAALVGGSAMTVIGSDAVLQVLGYESRLYVDEGLLLLLPIAIVALVVTAAAISLAASDRRVVLEVAERESKEVAEQRRQSTFLHNSLQSELTGMALQLDEAARSGSTEDARSALERVHSLLSRSISEDFANFQENPGERLERIVAGWRGICAVDVEVDEGVIDDPRLTVAVQAIEEIIANSVRHGGATRIAVNVGLTSEGVTVRVETDARVVDERVAGGGGLGSRVLQAMAPGGMVVEPSQVGSRIELTVP